MPIVNAALDHVKESKAMSVIEATSEVCVSE